MASIVTLRPNGFAYMGSGYWFEYPAAAAIDSGDWAKLQDNNDGTHLYGIMSTVDEFHLHFGSITLAANQRCARARLGHRIGGKSDTFPMSLDSWMAVPGYLGDGSLASHSGVIPQWTQYWNPWHEAEFSNAAIGAIQGRYRKLDNTTTPAISESYVELDVRTQPTVSITSPTAGSIAYTRRPTVSWSYNAQGDAVRAHQVKVFSAAQVGAGGFNPDSSAATWDSGRVSGAATSKQVGVDLARGTTYYFYVKLASDFRGTDWWSNWASRHVVINALPVASAVTIDPPTPITTTNKPTIGWTYSDANGDAQNQYSVRVYSEAVYSAPGFNEGDVASAAWGSGVVASATARSAQTGALSPNVNYKAYVWVTDAEGAWSPSAQSGVFVIQTAPGVMADPPAAPEVVSAAADNANQRVVVAVEGRDNLLTRNQSTIDTGVMGWEADTNVAAGAITRDTTTFLQGGGALRFVATNAGSTKVRTVGNQQLPVGPNRTFTALASLRAAGATARTAQMLVNWYDAGGGYLSTTVGAAQAINNAGWTQAMATDPAPADAAYAQLILEVTDAAAGEAFLADNIGMAPGTSTTWQRGGFVTEAGTLADAFNRADNASSLGTADQGGAWTAHNGTWGITGSRAYRADPSTSPYDSIVLLTSSHLADGYVEADIALSAGQALGGLVFRAGGLNDMLMVRLWKSATLDQIEMYKRDGGTWTQLASVLSAGLTLGTTYRVRAEFFGGQVLVYVDDDLRISHLLLAGEHTKYGAYGGYGLYGNNAATADDGGTRWDNFRAALDPTQLVTVERSLDDGTTWYPLRGAVRYDLGPTQLGTFYDYEVSAGDLAQYRVTAFASEAGEEHDTTGVAQAQDAALVIDRWWLKDAVDPSLNMIITVAPPFQFRRKEPMQAYDPMGRRESVFVSDGAKGVEGQLNIWCKDKATWDKLQALLGNGRALLLQNPLGHNWWVKFADQDYQLVRAQSDAGDGSPIRHFHAVALPFVQVSAPAVV